VLSALLKKDMNFFTPPNTPPRAPSAAAAQIPVAEGLSTPRHGPTTPLAHAAHNLGRLFTENSGSPAARATGPITAGTPGRVSTVQDPSSRQTNDIHVFPKGLTTYRGDNSFKPNEARTYRAQFFTLEKQVAQNQYGKLVLQFKLQKDIKVLRLDKNAEGFHHWLKNTKQFKKGDKDILYNNFGYPKNSPENAGSSEAPRARFSQGEQDRTMLRMIQCYAQDTGQQIDGYYNSTMPNGALGNLKTEAGKAPLFHAELAVFDGSVFGQPKMDIRLSADDIQSLNHDAKRIKLEAEAREARRNSKKLRLDEGKNPSKVLPAWVNFDKT
jgi:hypothetical protein